MVLLVRKDVNNMLQSVVVKKHEKIKYQAATFYNLSNNYYDHDFKVDKHWHNSIEITYVVQGEKLQKMENKEILAREGTLLLVNSGVSHSVEAKKGIEGIMLLIDRNYIDNLCPKVTDKRFDIDKNESVKQRIINHLFQAIAEKYQNNGIRCTINVLEIIDLFTTYLVDDNYYPKEKHDDELYELAISICEYLDYNYKNRISLDDLAKLTNYNKSYLATAFKKKMGITIFEYLSNVRIQHSLDDLKNGNDTIVEIALNNGFANIQIFNKTFKKVFNMTPKQYRNKNLK